MLSRIPLDANGNGEWNPPTRLKQLSITNQTSAPFTFFLNDNPTAITLNPGIAVEFEEEEVETIVKIGFRSGPSNTEIVVAWA